MAYKIKCKNGKSFTYLSPKEKYEKYQDELWAGIKLTNTRMPKMKAGYQPQFLTAKQKKYREDYISSYETLNKKSNSKGALDFSRDYENYIKYHSQNRKNKI